MQRALSLASAVGLALVLCGGPVAAQTQLAEYKLTGPLGPVGDRVGLGGDVDGDGVMDLLVAGDIGVNTYSGAGYAKLGFQPIPPLGQFDYVVAVVGLDDVDGDGQPDFVLSRSIGGVTAYSRGAGAAIWHLPGSLLGSLGISTDIISDLDRDGLRDVVLGEPHADPAGISSAGTIHIVSAATGASIQRINGTYDHQKLGELVATFQDLDADGLEDLIVGDSSYAVGGTTFGRVLVLSSATGAILRAVASPTAGFGFPMAVGDGGDLDGDGIHELAALSVVSGSPWAQAWSGADASPVWTQPGTETTVLRAVGDTNGDGTGDLVVGSVGFLSAPGTGRLLDGATGTTIDAYTGPTPGSWVDLAAPGDLSGDGLPEIVVANLASIEPGPAAFAYVRALPSGDVLHTLSNPPADSGLGSASADVGDFDGDGLADIALASQVELVIFSRASGAILREIQTVPPDSASFGAMTVAGPGDVNGDGTPDLVLGDNEKAGRVVLYSGATGATLASATGATIFEDLGTDVTATIDRNGDGVRDLLVGVPGRSVGGVSAAGEVVLLSGTDLAPLGAWHGLIQTGGRFGASVDAGGDLNGDGIPELAVGSKEELPAAPVNSGALHVLDGATGAILLSFGGQFDSGHVVGVITGDTDGDESPDLLVADPMWPQFGAVTGKGRVRLFSGSSGALRWEHVGVQNDSLGWITAAAGDVNGDGYADVAFSRGAGANSRIVVDSGLDGSELDAIDISDVTDQTGNVLAVGRFDAGACDDLLCGTTGLDGNGGAQVFASSQGGVHGFTDLGFAKANSAGVLPTLRFYGGLDGGELFTVKARHLPPSKPGSWFIGLTAGYVPFKQGVLVPSPFGLFLRIIVASNGAGEFTLSAANPASVFTGLSIYHQIWIQDPGVPGGVCATNGLAETFK